LARTREDPIGARWGLGYALAGAFIGLVLSNVLASAWLAAHPGVEDLSLGGIALAQIGLWVGLVGAPLLASRWHGSGRPVEDFGLRGRTVDLLTGTVVGVLSQVVLVPTIAFLMRPLVGRPDVSGPVEELIESGTGLSLAILVLSVTVAAPLVEELFFRGLVLLSIQRRLGIVWAVVLSSVLFGLAHPQDLPPAGLVLVMVSLAVFGVVLAVLTVRTRRLGPAIVAHAVFNAWTVGSLLLR
jgi:membrane protease YdiL (CAAX protease family)